MLNVYGKRPTYVGLSQLSSRRNSTKENILMDTNNIDVQYYS